MESYWSVGTEAPDTPPLPSTLRVDAAVVGAGFSGIAAAYYLAEAGLSVALLEAGEAADGASGRNGGQVLPGWSENMVRVADRHGVEVAGALWSLAEEALRRVSDLAAMHNIDCDLARVGHLEAGGSAREIAELEAELRFLERWRDRNRSWWDAAQIEAAVGTRAYLGGYFDPGGMAFHPRRYALGLLGQARRMGVQLYQHTPVRGWERRHGGFRVGAGQGFVECREIVLATNAYPPAFAPWLRSRILPVSSAQVAIRLSERDVLPPAMPTVSDTKAELNYYRRVGQDTFLFGGRALASEFRRGDFASLRRQLADLFPSLARAPVTHQWSGRIAITRDFIPHLMRMPDGVWTLGGYTGHGAALSTEFGFLAAHAVTHERPDPRAEALMAMDWHAFPLGRAGRHLFPVVVGALDVRRRLALKRR